MPTRYCSHPPCRNRVSGGGRCASCRRKADVARGTAPARGYDAAWARWSKRWLALHRWCGERADFRRHPQHSRCAQRGELVRADCTDHIVALAAGGAHMDPANAQSLCGACNRRKAIALEGALGGIR